jgi:hypothetical protein
LEGYWAAVLLAHADRCIHGLARTISSFISVIIVGIITIPAALDRPP